MTLNHQLSVPSLTDFRNWNLFAPKPDGLVTEWTADTFIPSPERNLMRDYNAGQTFFDKLPHSDPTVPLSSTFPGWSTSCVCTRLFRALLTCDNTSPCSSSPYSTLKIWDLRKYFKLRKKLYQILAAMLNLASHEIKMSIVCEISAAIGQLSKNS